MKFINRPIILIFGSRESVGKNLDKFEDSRDTRVDASETSRIILENYFSFIIIIIIIVPRPTFTLVLREKYRGTCVGGRGGKKKKRKENEGRRKEA